MIQLIFKPLLILFTVLNCVLWVSCTKNDDVNDGPYLALSLSGSQIATYASIPSLTEDKEKGVAKLRLFIFDSRGVLELNQVFIPNNSGRIDNPLVKLTQGDKHLFLVANEDGKSLVGGTATTILNDISTIQELRAKVAEVSLLTEIPSTGLLMSGEAEVTLKASHSMLTPLIVQVPLVRMSSKLTIKARKESLGVSGLPYTFRINSIKLLNCTDKEYLFGSYPSGPFPAVETAALGSRTVTSTDYETLTAIYPTTNVGSYTPTSNADAMRAKINYTIDNLQGEDVVTIATGFNVERNTHYTLNVTGAYPGVYYSVTEKPWEDVSVDVDIPSSEKFLFASDNKVTKGTLDETIYFAANESVFVWAFYTTATGDVLITNPNWVSRTVTYNAGSNNREGSVKFTFKTVSSLNTGNSIYLRLRAGNIVRTIEIRYQ